MSGAGASHYFSRVFGLILAALGLLAAAPCASAQSMSFHLEPLPDGSGCRSHCPNVIVAEGQIVNSTPQEFLNFLRENAADKDLRTVVFLNSQGGYVVASMELGQIFRRIGAATVVARLGAASGRGRFRTSSCLSACVYAFMGGRKRVAPPGSALGIHRMFANTEHTNMFGDSKSERVYDNGAMAGMLMNYSSRMGVSRDLIRFAEHISSQSIHLVTPGEMARWNLASRIF
ncbi:hypothetical protein [uncultured Rhodoblastus sp.]|uniref:COG3904 family protein n=1 Tax=uncultured Rhodoblastus sp. TaxID=543037 RepID=UPI0025E5C348|nr:hypothetical protein [uncultured Rhodoblastus sp.]